MEQYTAWKADIFTVSDNVAYFLTNPGRCECSSFHDYSVQDYILPGYDAVTLGNSFPNFRTAIILNSMEVSRHRFFLVSLCPKANAEMVPKIPSCHYMLLM